MLGAHDNCTDASLMPFFKPSDTAFQVNRQIGRRRSLPMPEPALKVHCPRAHLETLRVERLALPGQVTDEGSPCADVHNS